MLNTPLLTVYLPIRNAAHFIPMWLERNLPEFEAVSAKILVIDNGSTDESLKMIRNSGYKGFSIHEKGENLGILHSNKLADKLIDTKYKLLLPADDWLSKGYTHSALDIMERDDSLGVVYGRGYMCPLEGPPTLRRHPWRTTGARKESILFPLAFNNLIPDISVYRSESIGPMENLGGMSRLLRDWNVYYTGQDHCFSTKSDAQVSKQWAKNGEYFSIFMDVHNHASMMAGDHHDTEGIAMSNKLTIEALRANFLFGISLKESLELIVKSGNYACAVINNDLPHLATTMGSILIDELFIGTREDPKLLDAGRFGQLDDILYFANLTDQSHVALTNYLADRGVQA